MFSAIRRVISDSEDVGKSHKKAKTMMNSEEAQETIPMAVEGVRTVVPHHLPDSHLVEPDHASNVAAPLKMVHSSEQSDNFASGSSLSDGSDHGSREGEEDALVPSITQQQQQPSPPRKSEGKGEKMPATIQRVDRNMLVRMDSAADGSSSGSQRASSQTSSRDWGWFEDVHQSTDGLNNTSEKRNNKKTNAPSQAPDIAPQEATHGT